MKDYTTLQADTYDQIALVQYGSDLATQDMMAENGTRNPELLTVWRFDYGRTLYLPEQTADQAAVTSLPEYRRPE